MPHKRVALLLRRWYIVLLALFITAGLVAVAFTQVPATYKATANVLVIRRPGPGPTPTSIWAASTGSAMSCR
ncbi:hypothetical protein SAMN05892883_4434 [Jatrophihabitans sp. GAS493]|uniref:hypothetical protein n=1 Tax=Jatrophihabitans sp. GAS493 TaxID=1907575 RepID=UPI000BB7E51D|nr:hypothetical protein [Jatrophihabitans sp. GAS493]SOD75223.1 hypothetical protein SAMN05892883_4434 [Jatrophihabitans sp. GAS493]